MSAKKLNPAKLANVKAIAPTLAPTLHKLVAADLRTVCGIVKAVGAEFHAFAAVLEAAPLQDIKMLDLLKDDIKATFGDAHKDAAQIRINILNNARAVQCGGTKDKKTYPGRGRQAMLDAISGVSSIRELKPAMVEAKPEALKDARGGKREGAGKAPTKAKAKKAGQVANVARTASRADAFKAACDILAFVETNFLKAGTDADTIGKLEATIAALRAVA